MHIYIFTFSCHNVYTCIKGFQCQKGIPVFILMARSESFRNIYSALFKNRDMTLPGKHPLIYEYKKRTQKKTWKTRNDTTAQPILG